MHFNEYQRQAGSTDQNPLSNSVDDDPHNPKRQETIPLLGLVGEVGSLLAEYKKLLRDGRVHRRFNDEVAEELGDILWYVSNVADKFGLSLEDIAQNNLDKVKDRWLPPGIQQALYDEDEPQENQKLPRQFRYRFEERISDEATKVVLIDELNPGQIGDTLTDNSYQDDGYRFHDVLHLAFAVYLGWSPVLRKILRNKERMENRISPGAKEVEDGGRAQVIEEAITLDVYLYASNHDFLEGVDTIDWNVLRRIEQMTENIEVGNRTFWEWNKALLSGFKVWRQLLKHSGGVVSGDLINQTLEFSPPQK